MALNFQKSIFTFLVVMFVVVGSFTHFVILTDNQPVQPINQCDIQGSTSFSCFEFFKNTQVNQSFPSNPNCKNIWIDQFLSNNVPSNYLVFPKNIFKVYLRISYTIDRNLVPLKVTDFSMDNFSNSNRKNPFIQNIISVQNLIAWGKGHLGRHLLVLPFSPILLLTFTFFANWNGDRFFSKIFWEVINKTHGRLRRKLRIFLFKSVNKLNNNSKIQILKISLFIALLICGDVHPNPGPAPVNMSNNLNVAAWNVRTLLESRRRAERPSAVVARELARYNIDIAALSETRVSEYTSFEEVGGGYTFFLRASPFYGIILVKISCSLLFTPPPSVLFWCNLPIVSLLPPMP